MIVVPLPLPGSPAARVLIEALTQYTDNQREYIESENEPNPCEVAKLTTAESLLTLLEAQFIAAVGV